MELRDRTGMGRGYSYGSYAVLCMGMAQMVQLLAFLHKVLDVIRLWLGINRDTDQAERDRDEIEKDIANRPNPDRDLDPWMRD